MKAGSLFCKGQEGSGPTPRGISLLGLQMAREASTRHRRKRFTSWGLVGMKRPAPASGRALEDRDVISALSGAKR